MPNFSLSDDNHVPARNRPSSQTREAHTEYRRGDPAQRPPPRSPIAPSSAEPVARRPRRFTISEANAATALATVKSKVGVDIYENEKRLWLTKWTLEKRDATGHNFSTFLASVYENTKAHGSIRRVRAFIYHLCQLTQQPTWSKDNGHMNYPEYNMTIQLIDRDPAYLAHVPASASSHSVEVSVAVFAKLQQLLSVPQPQAEHLNMLVIYTLGLTCALRPDDIHKLHVEKAKTSKDLNAGDGRSVMILTIEACAVLGHAGSKNSQGKPVHKTVTCTCTDYAIGDQDAAARDTFDCTYHILQQYMAALASVPPTGVTFGRLIRNPGTANSNKHLLTHNSMGVKTISAKIVACNDLLETQAVSNFKPRSLRMSFVTQAVNEARMNFDDVRKVSKHKDPNIAARYRDKPLTDSAYSHERAGLLATMMRKPAPKSICRIMLQAFGGMHALNAAMYCLMMWNVQSKVSLLAASWSPSV